MADTYRDAIKKAQKELEGLVEERKVIDRKIHRVRQGIQGLAALSGIPVESLLSSLTVYENRGLTSGIKAVLQGVTGPKTAAEVRHLLSLGGFNLSDYANASAVINTVLNRLVDQGIVKKDDKAHPATYVWVGENKKDFVPFFGQL